MSRAAERRKARRDRRKDRREAKQTRRDSRRQARLERKQTRKDARTARVQSRTERKIAAYESGIDPNAWIGDSIGQVADAAGGALTSKFQSQMQNPAMGPRNEEADGGSNNNTMLLIGAALVGFMLMKK